MTGLLLSNLQIEITAVRETKYDSKTLHHGNVFGGMRLGGKGEQGTIVEKETVTELPVHLQVLRRQVVSRVGCQKNFEIIQQLLPGEFIRVKVFFLFPGLESTFQHGMYVEGKASAHLTHSSFRRGGGRPDFQHFGFFFNDKHTATQGHHAQLFQLGKQHADGISHIPAVLHGHGAASQPFQGCFYLCLPGLGFGFLQVQKADVGLLKNPGKTLQDHDLVLCKCFS